ncbi:MAG: helix-turn-helix domain-containing protein [Treponema sp.]|jgi:transcriptional regulator with XRE-family HTH domain|nr:helix-turn-helix domain-containing protein [Treponema sp.]
MPDFAERLRSEIEYAGYNQKEFAAKADIKKRALDMYLGVQKSMPPADVAVKIASALGLSVEYLVTGRETRHPVDISRYLQFRGMLDDLSVLSGETLAVVKAMVKAAADLERRTRDSSA